MGYPLGNYFNFPPVLRNMHYHTYSPILIFLYWLILLSLALIWLFCRRAPKQIVAQYQRTRRIRLKNQQHVSTTNQFSWWGWLGIAWVALW